MYGIYSVTNSGHACKIDEAVAIDEAREKLVIRAADAENDGARIQVSPDASLIVGEFIAFYDRKIVRVFAAPL